MPLRRTMKEEHNLDPGTYKVRLMDLKEATLENPQFGNGDVIRFVLETVDVVDGEGNPIELDGIANDKLSPMSKLTRWLSAFGVTSKPGEEVDMEDAVDREAMAVIVNKPGKDGTGAFPRIEDLVPLPKTGNGRTARPTEPPVTTDGAVMEIGDWWALTRQEGFERIAVIEKSKVMFGEEPPNISPAERTALLEELRKG